MSRNVPSTIAVAYHSRCLDCANLQARRLSSFANTDDAQEWKLEWDDHHRMKRDWREFEAGKVQSARHDPERYLVFLFDATNGLGLPKFTNRPQKGLTTSRFVVVPWLISDVATGKDYYFYVAQDRFKTDGNRLCTYLMRVFRAKKFGTHPSRRAREVSLIADSCSQNKNNTLLAFCTHLIIKNWFDSIELLFGPVGHTHNGVDHQHQIHNEILGNFTSLNFVELVARFEQAWSMEHARPIPVVLDEQLDWENYYKPFMQPIGGHTNTPKDPVGVRGFRICRGRRGVVEVLWKTHAESSGKWRGADGNEGSPGFAILRGVPAGEPKVIPPATTIMDLKYYKQLTGSRLFFSSSSHLHIFILLSYVSHFNTFF